MNKNLILLLAVFCCLSLSWGNPQAAATCDGAENHYQTVAEVGVTHETEVEIETHVNVAGGTATAQVSKQNQNQFNSEVTKSEDGNNVDVLSNGQTNSNVGLDVNAVAANGAQVGVNVEVEAEVNAEVDVEVKRQESGEIEVEIEVEVEADVEVAVELDIQGDATAKNTYSRRRC